MNPSATEPALESALLEAMIERREGSFEQFYDRYARLVYSVAARVLRRQEEVEEAVQDAFVAAWNGAASYCPQRGSVSTWLAQVAHNKALDCVRRSSRADVPSPDAVARADAGRSLDAWAAGVTDELSRLVEADELRCALDQLSAAQRETIELTYFSGLTESEVAATLGIPRGTVKSRLSSGMRQLRQSIGWPGRGS